MQPWQFHLLPPLFTLLQKRMAGKSLAAMGALYLAGPWNGIAVGGVWAYFILGWGGFWHGILWRLHRSSRGLRSQAISMRSASQEKQENLCYSYANACSGLCILIIYAAIVVRSGLFNSVHAFGEASTGTLLLLSIALTTLVSLGLGIKTVLLRDRKRRRRQGSLE